MIDEGSVYTTTSHNSHSICVCCVALIGNWCIYKKSRLSGRGNDGVVCVACEMRMRMMRMRRMIADRDG